MYLLVKPIFLILFKVTGIEYKLSNKLIHLTTVFVLGPINMAVNQNATVSSSQDELHIVKLEASPSSTSSKSTLLT